MDNATPSSDLPLAERLRRSAGETPPDKQRPIIRKIVEARQVLAELRMRGYSWSALADLLMKESVHLSAGTLRNYMAKIGKAEAALLSAGETQPSDDEIHAALRQKTVLPLSPAKSAPPAPIAALAPPVAARTARQPSPKQSLNRNENRDL